MKVKSRLRKAEPNLPMVMAATLDIQVDESEMAEPVTAYDPIYQRTLSSSGDASYCNVDESVKSVFNSSADMKSDD